MLISLRRARGVLLRLVFRQRAAFVVGWLLVGLAGGLLAADFAWESWVSDGLSLVLGASGVALLIAALGERRSN